MSAILARIVGLWQQEPAVITGLVAAILAVAVGFGLSQGTAGSITGAVALLTSFVTRTFVTPTAQLPAVGTLVPGSIPPGSVPHG